MVKRGIGIGHVEAILSFVLFISFVSVALFFFIPTGDPNVIDSSLNYALNGIIKNSSVMMDMYSIKIYKGNIPAGQDTISIEFPTEISEIPSDYKVRAETYEGSPIQAERDGNFVYVKPGNEDFIVLKFSPDLTEYGQISSKPAENPDYYQVASSSTKEVLSEKRLLTLNQSYYVEYDSLKESLGIPSQVSFGFAVNLPNENVIAERNIAEGIEVYSTLSRRELLLQKDGVLTFGEVNVKIW